MNPITAIQFRSEFPEFSDVSKYSDSSVNSWLTVAANLLNPDRWQQLLTTGIELCAAHYLVIASRDQSIAQFKGIPGTPKGLMTAESVGDLSASYDFSTLMNADAGFWNQTTYGQRYWSLARMMGAGGLQIW
jgi:hypothetical protein